MPQPTLRQSHIFINGTLAKKLNTNQIASLLTKTVAPQALNTSRIVAKTFVSDLRSTLVSKRTSISSAAATRINKVRAAKGVSVKAAIASRVPRTPQQIIKSFIQRVSTPANLKSLASGAATLLIRSTESNEKKFSKILENQLGVELEKAKIKVKKLPLANNAVTSYAVVFPILHQKVSTELLNLAWALRQSKVFLSIGVSGLQANLFAVTPTAATHAQRNFDWHLDLTRTSRAHQIPALATGQALGAGITIAHIDTGWAPHSQYNINHIDVTRSRNAITGASGGSSARHSITNQDSDSPNISHGTATGSIILGGVPSDGRELTSTETDEALRFGVWPNGTRQHVPGRSIRDQRGHLTGMAPQATVLPIKFISDSAAKEATTRGVSGVGVFRLFDLDLVQGVRDAIDQGAHVISLSVGGLMHDPVREILDEAILEHDMIVAAAVGQTYMGNVVSAVAGGLSKIGIVADDSVILPAAYSNVIAVAGCAPSGAPWSESHCGPNVDITAPADGIWVADYMPKDDRSGSAQRAETLECASGTSFAAPMVASAAALWLAHHGRQALIDRYRPPGAQGIPLAWVFRHLLQATARALPGWDDGRYGPGILDTEALLRAPLPNPADVEPPPTMVGGLVPAVSGAITGAQEGFLEFLGWLGEQKDGAERQAAVQWAAGQKAVDESVDKLGEMWATIDAAAQGATAAVVKEANKAKQAIEGGIADLLEKQEELLETAGDAVEQAIDVAGNAVEDFADSVGEAASDAVNSVAGWFGW